MVKKSSAWLLSVKHTEFPAVSD